MLVNDFIKAVNESREACNVGKPTNDGKAMSGRRSVPVAKMKPRLNATETPKEVKKPTMGQRKEQKPTANVGAPSNDGIKFSGRRQVSVAKVKESEAIDDSDLVLED